MIVSGRLCSPLKTLACAIPALSFPPTPAPSSFAATSNLSVLFSTCTMSVPFPSSDWFQAAFGFREGTYNDTKHALLQMKESSSDPAAKLRWQGASHPPVEITFGSFSTPSVQDLRGECARLTEQYVTGTTTTSASRIFWSNIQASVLDLHADPANAGAIFQAASQFNCLEMVSPSISPQDGITRYYGDHTQGPACAIACGSGTAYRNYLVELPNGRVGQTAYKQINTLAPILDRLTHYNNGEKVKIKFKNGYVDAGRRQLAELRAIVDNHGDELVGLLQVGSQRDTEVTHPFRTGRLVTQVYCSAIPVSYSYATSGDDWAPLARVVLKGAYEATLLEGVRKHLVKQQQQPGSYVEPTKVFLTMVGGGAFGNEMGWIWEAMQHAHNAVRSYPVSLDVHIVHYSHIDEGAVGLVNHINL